MRIPIVLCIASLLLSTAGQSQSLESVIIDEMFYQDIPGLSAIVVNRGGLMWSSSFGMADLAAVEPVNDSTAFMVASVSKLFTAMAAMRLTEEGIWNYNDPANDYLPFELLHPDYPGTQITIDMLMTHSSGIEDNWAAMNFFYNDFGDPLESLGSCVSNYFDSTGLHYDAEDNFYSYEPGTAYNYSNMGFALLGYLVESASAEPFNFYSEGEHLEKLCMENTGWFLADLDESRVAHPHVFSGGSMQPIDHFGFCDYPDGQLRASIRDLGNFMIAVLNEGEIGQTQVFEPTTLEFSMSPRIPAIEPSQGFGWYRDFVNGEEVWGHNGGETGTSADVWFDMDDEIAIAVLSNASVWHQPILNALHDYGLNFSGATSPVDCGSDVVDFAPDATSLDFSIYPNPSRGLLQVSAPQPARVEVFDPLGRLVWSSQLGTTTQIDLGDLEAGMYQVKLSTEKAAASRALLLSD